MLDIFLWFVLFAGSLVINHIRNRYSIRQCHYLYTRAGEKGPYDVSGRHWSDNLREWDALLFKGDPIYHKLSNRSFITFFLFYPAAVSYFYSLRFLAGVLIPKYEGIFSLIILFSYLLLFLILDKIDRHFLEKKIKGAYPNG